MALAMIALIICVTLMATPGLAIQLGWLFGQSNEVPSEGPLADTKGDLEPAAMMAKIPFELQAVDERFLREAEKFTGMRLSELDSCHHKIIFGLRKSCADLTEEEISKLSVNLLNCQSAVEGRCIFSCTSTMTIKECTKDMDKDTWNAYHIVSNRARAVCYGSRQTLFRAKTEMAVNRLVASTEDQLHAMTSLQEDQKKLGQATSEALDSVSVGHLNLLQQQEMLKAAQHNIQSYVASNIRELAREKNLIAVGHKNLEGLTQTIKDKLEAASVQLAAHGETYKRSQEEILLDLTRMHEKANQVWIKIDNSTQKILAQHRDSSRHYEETLERLHRVNESINYLLLLVENTRAEVDAKLNWLSELAGGTGDKLAVLLCVALHLGFFLLGAVSMAFVQAPFITRFALMVVVPLNCVTEINGGRSLDFSALTAVIFMSAILQWIVRIIWNCAGTKRVCGSGSPRPFLAAAPRVYSLGQTSGRSMPTIITPPGDNKNSVETYSDSDSEELLVTQNQQQQRTPEDDVTGRSSILQSVMTSVRKSFKSSFTGDVLNDTIEEQDEEDEEDSDYDDDDRLPLRPNTPRVSSAVLSPPLISTPVRPPTINGEASFTKRDLMDSINLSPRLTRRSTSRGTTPIRSDSPNTRPTCQGSSVKGHKCRLYALYGKNFCHVHIDTAQ